MITTMKLAAFAQASGVPFRRSLAEMTIAEYVAMSEWLVGSKQILPELTLFGKN